MHHRFIMLAHPLDGSASLSWRTKCALENLGHTVFWFSPRTHPFLFEETDSARNPNLSGLATFIARQRPDALIIADGLGLTDEQQREARQLAPALAHLTLDTLVPRPLVDETYLTTPLANTIAYPPRLICLQDATEERIEALRRLEATVKTLKLPVRCTGDGWPQEWRTDKAMVNGFAYTSRSAVVRILFADGGPGADANLEALAQADGAPVITVGNGTTLTDTDLNAAEDALRALGKEGFPREAPRLPRNTEARENGTTLEAELARTLTALEYPADGGHPLEGTDNPRTIVSILGYFGMGNYGDEYILATLDERLRTAMPGASIIAVSENPCHTLEKRGIYAVSLKELPAVDRVLAFSSAALVVAGLLFDQGIRWTAGKAETFTSARVSDIPGITAYASLAAANDTPVVFHGIGAGPLEVLDGRQLVKLMGKQGALFTPRDQETADLIRSCGVPEAQIIPCADTIFLNTGEKAVVCPASEDRAPASATSEDSPVVAISLREYENTPADFSKRMAQALDAVAAEHPEAVLTFCVLDPGDLKLSEAVIGAMERQGQCRVFTYNDDLETLTELLRGAQAGFSMRYHSALVMGAFGIPCVGMDYLPKVASLYRDLGIEELLVSPSATAAESTAALLSAFDKAEHWKRCLQENTAPLQASAQEAFDLLLEQIAATSPSKDAAIPQEFLLHTVPAPHRRQAALEKELTAAKKDAAALKEDLARTKRRLRAARKKAAGDGKAASKPVPVLKRILRKLTDPS